MMSLGSVGFSARETLRTGLVMMNPRSVLSSRRKPTWTLRSFRKLPPSELPARRACVNTGKNAPPRTSTCAVSGESRTISYVLFSVLTIRHSSASRSSTCTPPPPFDRRRAMAGGARHIFGSALEAPERRARPRHDVVLHETDDVGLGALLAVRRNRIIVGVAHRRRFSMESDDDREDRRDERDA